MDVQYPPDARQWTDGLTLLEQASSLLNEILGPKSSHLVKAEWNRVQDQPGRTLYRLTIQDLTGKVSTDFALEIRILHSLECSPFQRFLLVGAAGKSISQSPDLTIERTTIAHTFGSTAGCNHQQHNLRLFAGKRINAAGRPKRGGCGNVRCRQ